VSNWSSNHSHHLNLGGQRILPGPAGFG